MHNDHIWGEGAVDWTPSLKRNIQKVKASQRSCTHAYCGCNLLALKFGNAFVPALCHVNRGQRSIVVDAILGKHRSMFGVTQSRVTKAGLDGGRPLCRHACHHLETFHVELGKTRSVVLCVQL
jgi:hypothetical protein